MHQYKQSNNPYLLYSVDELYQLITANSLGGTSSFLSTKYQRCTSLQPTTPESNTCAHYYNNDSGNVDNSISFSADLYKGADQGNRCGGPYSLGLTHL